ncbi:IS66 family insertion sequence element accessory protein TnpB [Methylomonas sp. AM2-LC]|uniref:IS66 family insertion sequence element accessory protein TnpA n=1 Tax=Methylomonas sp. AM2-LC TaxID=3153301 RepID=UPI003267230F
MSLPSKWISHIENWQRSGLKQVDYCQQQGLNYNTFSARLCDYRKRFDQSLPALIPVQVQGAGKASDADRAIILKHSKGHQLDLPVSTSALWLAELLRCLD